MDINTLPYYPRFVFNCSDGKMFSTADLSQLTFIKNDGFDQKVDSFQTGRGINILWDDQKEYKKYKVTKIDIRDIRYDTDEKLYGIYEDDTMVVYGQEKFHPMSIFIFLEAINQ